MDQIVNMEHVRTLSIVQQLAQGKVLTLPNGWEVAMGEDMSIGFPWKDAEGRVYIGGLSTMDLAELNRLLNEYGIGMAIPSLP
jgi:hypothetical protein